MLAETDVHLRCRGADWAFDPGEGGVAQPVGGDAAGGDPGGVGGRGGALMGRDGGPE